MGRFLLARLIRMVLVLLGVSTVVFGTLRLTGDPAEAILSFSAVRPEDVQAFRELLGLDQPLYVQYFHFMSSALRGDLGRSFVYYAPVLPIVLQRFPATLQLTAAAMLIALAVGVLLGVSAATRRNSTSDLLCMVAALLGQSMPVFWLGLMLILVFSVWLRWLPPMGAGGIQHLVLPALALSTGSMAAIARLTRSTMLDVLGEDYVRTARAKGLRERAVVYGHALRNAALPVVTLVGLQFGYLLGGAVVLETVFAWPGVGLLAVTAVYNRDFPMVQACVFLVAVCFVVINLFVDLLYAALDPRIKLA
ncbi:MAG: ABC transporter permease [Chloroflexi bacterium]|nr:ABC transporter permease [Chloroflexota bacterium]